MHLCTWWENVYNGKELKKTPFLEELGQVGAMAVTEPWPGTACRGPGLRGLCRWPGGPTLLAPKARCWSLPVLAEARLRSGALLPSCSTLGRSRAIAPLAPAGAAHQGGMCPAPRPEHPPRAAREDKLGFILFELVQNLFFV